MHILYADESGSTGIDYDNTQQPIFILGGFIVNDKKWHEINNLFNKKKIEINPIFKDHEIHTNEIFNSSKKSVFDIFDWKENLKTLENIADLICELDIEFFFAGIDKPKFKQHIIENKEKSIFLDMDPYISSYVKLHQNISNYIDKTSDENGLIFLDEFVSLDDTIPVLSSLLPERYNFKNNIIENALFLKSDASNFIQIADFYAFYINKFYCIEKGYKKYSPEKTRHCLYIASKLLKKTNIEYCSFLDKI